MDGHFTLGGQNHTQPNATTNASGVFQTNFVEMAQSVVPLLADGSNFDSWDSSMQESLALVEGASVYLSPGVLPSWPLWQQDLADGVNQLLHYSTDPYLRMIIHSVSPHPSLRYAHLTQLFAGIPFANRLNQLEDLLLCRYSSTSDTVDTYVARMWNQRRDLQRHGMSIGDDVFAALLILGTPETFEINTHRFEQAVRMHPQVPVDSHWVVSALLEDEAIARHLHRQSTLASHVYSRSSMNDVASAYSQPQRGQ
ncbi:uncharacterized protein MELLADRAFT_66221 [Melampsora larici-populina 98AG31]|uniref:Retrotransposon Copia-like N-terminal domain-containing protein n=1 Tax=Melampsora larici-populina (strain 98AG31 / pathotype 3-4-7) TaxID=747676 RepID=F4RYB1_MELLP|nr:uncharacterized protein MELLADRAFT_66221 [Melampsora larici-populina 98AG31]EGG02667.1 hypothetical protein MELLADRAFT_66221 [Melampsora larici-populina 98AG31]